MALMLAVSAMMTQAKDVGPANPVCDAFVKGTADWKSCAAFTSSGSVVGATDKELFYAGYWLAKTGQYQDALRLLQSIQHKDSNALTYIGFATRKLGGVERSVAIYRQALAADANNVVTRAYLGEAYLSLSKPDAARAQLREIARRCGVSCAPYAELAIQIAGYDTHPGNG